MAELLWRIAVTFCEEGVDWNRCACTRFLFLWSHLLWGRCGLKCPHRSQSSGRAGSPSVRKVWIEIARPDICWLCYTSPSVRKVWIEIFSKALTLVSGSSHLLWGRCGLKYRGRSIILVMKRSPSVRKVWIEISRLITSFRYKSSPSVRKVWIEIVASTNKPFKTGGHLLWGRCGLKYICHVHAINQA